MDSAHLGMPFSYKASAFIMFCTFHVQTLWEIQWYKYLRAAEEDSLSTHCPQLQQVTATLETEILSSIQFDTSHTQRQIMDVIVVTQTVLIKLIFIKSTLPVNPLSVTLSLPKLKVKWVCYVPCLLWSLPVEVLTVKGFWRHLCVRWVNSD